MHVKGFLHKILTPVIHRARVNALTEVTLAAICTKTLVLTTLGRAIDTGIQERSGIQKVNRLLGNRQLLKEQTLISQTLSGLLIGHKKQAEIIVDWSKYPGSDDAILRAALATAGRALTLYEERHPLKKMGNRGVQKNFLVTLKKILPATCQAILVTDAGFHNEWFREVVALGWNYVGRIRGLKKCRLLADKGFYPCKRLFKQATHHAQCLGEIIVTQKNPLTSYGYLIKGKLKGRKALTKRGYVRHDKDSKAYSRAHREPWLLASSLSGRQAAKQVTRLYARRMTIEEAFRDLKSARYGLGLNESKTQIKTRRDILLLIGRLASFMAYLTGMVGEKMALHYQFQSNSIKHRRVLSLFYVGCQIIKKKIPLPLSLLEEAITSLKKEVIDG